MKSFKTFIEENYNSPVVSIEKTKVDLDDDATLNELNKNLDIVLSVGFSNLDDALNKAKKILTMYGVEIGPIDINDEKKGSISIPITTHKDSGENFKFVSKPFEEFDENHIFKINFERIEGIYKVSAGVEKK